MQSTPRKLNRRNPTRGPTRFDAAQVSVYLPRIMRSTVVQFISCFPMHIHNLIEDVAKRNTLQIVTVTTNLEGRLLREGDSLSLPLHPALVSASNSKVNIGSFRPINQDRKYENRISEQTNI
ncbi:hypothetical protein CDAR_75321 [Caerostris darwini]|uniref:Uncharacterized protein n=1 Tax=Caerostris darwini TaxID=1538125 RepID=A0AAV4QNY2_9ARAC|nr:hypothetical protein CDAR_75321 [Caerostris darwini]